MDYITDRRMYVKINENLSKERPVKMGCIQGSVLGPQLFSMYVRGLQEYLWNRDGRVVTYADDSYIILEADTIQQLTEKSESCLKDHDDYLPKLGMRTNKSKTEVLVFNKEYLRVKLKFGGEEIESGNKGSWCTI